MAEWAGVISAVIAVIGLGFVAVELRRASAATRAQATIQFQAAFFRSQEARGRLQASFPLHESVLEELPESERDKDFRTWKELSELTDQERRDAEIVIGAMNDVAQYVVDGLALRSALQQYHTIFVRAGFLLLPYLSLRNAPVEGKPQARYGFRMADLYNAGISYHRYHWKHRGRDLALVRPAGAGPGQVRLTLLGTRGDGIKEHPGFGEDAKSKNTTSLAQLWMLRRVVRRAERHLRR
jgi:hypothetical protein